MDSLKNSLSSLTHTNSRNTLNPNLLVDDADDGGSPAGPDDLKDDGCAMVAMDDGLGEGSSGREATADDDAQLIGVWMRSCVHGLPANLIFWNSSCWQRGSLMRVIARPWQLLKIEGKMDSECWNVT
ncbi:UNVERIFIED_CONTAM: hypothetical protein Slati_1515400 [Sesamum latifolium]|uniref:Uncharacterized protein n=1 Tax=Sesamum latifolium TaxID=2727402 RepID=A0AAW2X679_9LAMI